MVTQGNVLVNIQVLDNGDIVATDAEGRALKELDSASLGESLNGKAVKKATVLPPITLLESNPRWVCIGGRWYYIP